VAVVTAVGVRVQGPCLMTRLITVCPMCPMCIPAAVVLCLQPGGEGCDASVPLAQRRDCCAGSTCCTAEVAAGRCILSGDTCQGRSMSAMVTADSGDRWLLCVAAGSNSSSSSSSSWHSSCARPSCGPQAVTTWSPQALYGMHML
jgi:hypothetical protein